MKMMIDEGIVRRAVREAINRLIKETDTMGVLQGGGTDPEAGEFTVPFGDVQRREIYNATGTKKKYKKKKNGVDMRPAYGRKNMTTERLK